MPRLEILQSGLAVAGEVLLGRDFRA